MVFQKRQNSGFVGQQISSMPRFPRSARGKRSPRKKIEINQLSPFDLLATLAGELLAKREINQSSCRSPAIDSPGEKIKKKRIHYRSPSKSDVFDQGSCDESSFVARSSLPAMESGELEREGKVRNDGRMEDRMNLDSKTPAVVSSDSSVEILPFEDYRTSSFLNFRDDDENSSGRTHGSSVYSAAFKPHFSGDRRKIEAMNDDYEGIKRGFRAHNLCYTRQRTRNSPFKKRKLFGSSSESNGVFCCDSMVKDGNITLDCGDLHSELNDAHGRPCFTASQRLSNESTNNQVRLTIKSFKVPELFVEIPANATLGSLKRTVMETMTAVLSGGVRVGVLLHGKKIRDDHKTLLQAGISSNDKLDDLVFTLEPTPTRAHPPLNSDSGDTEPINKIVTPPNQSNFEALPVNLMANCTESDIDSVQSVPDPLLSVDRMHDNSKAMVPILALNSDALAVVPICKSGQSEAAQRRIRRPFSVSEVELLVHAVEKLGTGRWRDVKLRAFEDAKHRTYVDLKDKWKTLVHTARISPQQRRGEPVPQGLLDRVLSAHSYWAQQQAKSAGPAGPIVSPDLGLVLA